MTIKVIVFEILLRLKQFKPEFFFYGHYFEFFTIPFKKRKLRKLVCARFKELKIKQITLRKIL